MATELRCKMHPDKHTVFIRKRMVVQTQELDPDWAVRDTTSEEALGTATTCGVCGAGAHEVTVICCSACCAVIPPEDQCTTDYKTDFFRLVHVTPPMGDECAPGKQYPVAVVSIRSKNDLFCRGCAEQAIACASGKYTMPGGHIDPLQADAGGKE